MEHLWSRAVATSGNRWQVRGSRKPLRQAKTVAVGCHRLPIGAHGKRRVEATSILRKRGSPSSLRKRVESCEPEDSQDSRLTLYARSPEPARPGAEPLRVLALELEAPAKARNPGLEFEEISIASKQAE